MIKPKRAKPLNKVSKISVKRKSLSDFKKFNEIILKSINEKEQLINLHLKKLYRITDFSSKDKNKFKYLIELAKDPLQAYAETSSIKAKEIFSKKNQKTDLMKKTLERKKLLEKLDALEQYEKLNSSLIIKKVNQRRLLSQKLKEKVQFLSSYIKVLRSISKRTSQVSAIKKIDQISKNKELLKLPFNKLEELILKEAFDLQTNFYFLKNKNSLIIEDIKKNVLVQPTRIKEIININKSLKINNSEIVNRSLNSVRLGFIEKIEKQRQMLSNNFDINNSRLYTIEETIAKNYSESKRYNLIITKINNLMLRFRDINKIDKSQLQQQIKELSSKLIYEKTNSKKFGNPLKEDPSQLEKYSRLRYKGVILSKVERELNTLVDEYYK